MQLAHSLHQEQRIKLFMTPELKQSIHILQMSLGDLVSYLQEQSVDNPFLEIEWMHDSFPGHYGSKLLNGNRFDLINPFGNMAAAKETLESWMMHQLRMTEYSSAEYRAFSFIAGNLDEAGYLAVDLEEARQLLRLPMDVLESALRKLQSFDPPGVGGRNLQECLAIQIARDPNAVEGALRVVMGHLQDLSKGKADKISKELDIDTNQVSRILDYIRTLDPRPGLAFVSGEEPNIVVDAHIRVERNRYVIEMNRNMNVKVSINKESVHLLNGINNEEAAHYFHEKIKSVDWLLRSLDHRNLTLFKVINAIMEEQIGFFEDRASGLRPMNLKSISHKLGIHESTVSRAVKDKYIHTPRGIYELKFFFSNGIQSLDGEDISSQHIKCMIKELIHKEDKWKPLSDQDIANALKNHGIRVSRRTVTKYREEEHLLRSAMRRRGR